MIEKVDYNLAKSIMRDNFIGIELLNTIDEMKFKLTNDIPIIKYSIDTLIKKKDDYLLILGLDRFIDDSFVTIKNIKKIFGYNPDANEPCFYNQDWYDKEDFINIPMKNEWFLIKKEVYNDSRAVLPNKLIGKYNFPNAINCVYAFFVAWLTLNKKLWCNDFVWCNDVDHNGDRIYVGKYYDIDCVNKNGFNIHRYLNLRLCYGCID